MLSRLSARSSGRFASPSRELARPASQLPRSSRLRLSATSSHSIAGASISSDRQFSDDSKLWMQQNTNSDDRRGGVLDALEGADVFIGVSAADLFDAKEIARMAKDPIVFGPRQSRPRVQPARGPPIRAGRGHRPIGFPQSDQQRARLPGIFRGALDARAPSITEAMNVAAARAIAAVVARMISATPCTSFRPYSTPRWQTASPRRCEQRPSSRLVAPGDLAVLVPCPL